MKTVQVTVTFQMDERTAKLFQQSSIERVINTSINMIERHAKNAGDQYINLEDWQEWKPVIVSMWVALHDGVFRFFRGMESNTEPFSLRKGD